MNYVLSCYFTRLPHLQYEVQWSKNDFLLMRPWAESVRALGLSAVLFYDELSPAFIRQYAAYPIQFVKHNWETPWNATEERFVAYRDWLCRCKDVEYVVTTDFCDVEFYQNPFGVITRPDVLYVGSDPETIGQSVCDTVQRWMLNAFGEVTNADKIILNPGILGGYSPFLVSFLAQFIMEMKKGVPGVVGLDLAAFNRLLYREHIPFCTSFPLHTVLRKNEALSCGCAIRHK